MIKWLPIMSWISIVFNIDKKKKKDRYSNTVFNLTIKKLWIRFL